MNLDSLGATACLHAVQIGLLSAIVFVVVKLFAQDRPHLAHALWALVLLKCLTPPVVASPLSPFSWLGTEHTTASITDAPSSSTADQLGTTEPTTIFFNYEPTPAPKPPRQNAPALAPPKTASAWLALAAGWLAGTCSLGLILCWRVAAYARMIQRKTIATPENLQNLTNNIAKRLSVRRTVRVRVIAGPIGPAVVGVLRPTLLLPERMISSHSQTSLQTLIAHELIHVRRGDLWWSAVQTTASLVWWFHPCVWLASRLITRETERSCDEETIASLGCRPAEYARTLLDVLEQKSEIVAAPLVPGVRPVDITFKRIERIMRIGHGSHPRTPRWITALLLIGATITLPGARWLGAQEQDTKVNATPQAQSEAPGKRLPTAKVLLEDAAVKPATPAPASWPELARGAAGDFLVQLQILDVPAELLAEIFDETTRIDLGGAVTSDLGIAGKLITGELTTSHFGSSLVAPASAASGTDLSWKSTTLVAHLRLHAAVQLSDEQHIRVLQWTKPSSDSGVRVHARPTLITRSGKPATYTSGESVPIIAGFDRSQGKPKFIQRQIGLRCEVTATLDEDPREVNLDCSVSHSVLVKQSESHKHKAVTITINGVKYQQPSIKAHLASFDKKVPLGSAVACLAGFERRDEGEFATVFVLTVSPAGDPSN